MTRKEYRELKRFNKLADSVAASLPPGFPMFWMPGESLTIYSNGKGKVKAKYWSANESLALHEAVKARLEKVPTKDSIQQPE